MNEAHKRTIARTVCWRIIATIITIPITGLSTAILVHVVLTVAHYFYERIWLKIKWGKIN
jgi:uncharacterized membrane protein